jgi:hypothetical protein
MPPEAASSTRLIAGSAPRSTPPVVRKSLPPPSIPPAPAAPQVAPTDEEIRAMVRAAVEASVAPLQRELESTTRQLDELRRSSAAPAPQPAPPPPEPVPVEIEVEIPVTLTAADEAQFDQLRRRPKPALFMALFVVVVLGALLGTTALSHL